MRSLPLSTVTQLLKCPFTVPLPTSLIQGYCIDSRLVKPGELFFALKGDRVDGHDYLEEVKRGGALAAVVSKQYQGVIQDFPLLVVDDPLDALQELARSVLAGTKARIVAITGSIGKTSTKEFTLTLLSTQYHVAASPGNSNSQVGIPLSILNHTTGEEDILVLEMGMTTPGNITKLIQIAPPEVAVITTVALVHACNFDSLEDIVRAKGEIFSHPHTPLGIFHHDIPLHDDLRRIGLCHKVTFSTQSSEADYGIDSSDSTMLQARLEKKTIPLGTLPVPGKHNLHNLLAAIAVARYFHIDWEKIQQAIPQLVLPERRLQFIQRKEGLFLNDSYNASELSVKAALETLPQPPEGGRKIAVLGSMLELGKFSDDCHTRVGEHALNYVDQLFCLGEECRPIYDLWKKKGRPVELFDSRQDLVACLRKNLKPYDVVLLKGSRSKELWKVLEELGSIQ